MKIFSYGLILAGNLGIIMGSAILESTKKTNLFKQKRKKIQK